MIGGCPCCRRRSCCLTTGLRAQAGRLKCTRENLAARRMPLLDGSDNMLLLKKKKKEGRMWQSSMVPVLPNSCSWCLLHLAASLRVPKPSLPKGGLGAE